MGTSNILLKAKDVVRAKRLAKAVAERVVRVVW